MKKNKSLFTQLHEANEKTKEVKNQYNILLEMSFRMAKLLERTLDFNEFLQKNNLPKN
jgi:hypothetical protein